jgi:multiple sugar transport system permease protein
VIGSFQVFDMVYLMTPGGGPDRSTFVYNYYLFTKGFRSFEMGYAAAMAWMLFLLIGLLTLVQFKVLNKRVQYELG